MPTSNTTPSPPLPKQSFKWRIVRPDDQLNLELEFFNLKLSNGILRRADPTADGLIAFNLGSQHVAEQAFTQDTPVTLEQIPIAVRIAEPSRLVFRLSRALDSLPFTLESLLDWGRALEPQLGGETRHRQHIHPPTAVDTAIELPARLVLAPFEPDSSRWIHNVDLDQGTDGNVIWHTRLGTRDMVSRAQVTAIWSPDYPLEDTTDPSSLRFALSPSQRRSVVIASHTRQPAQAPLQAELLVLSSMGGWLRLDGQWPHSESEAPALAKLHYRAAMGQDNRVVVVERGFLFPTGHRASLVQITERQLASGEPSTQGLKLPVASLVQHLHVAINAPATTYDATMVYERLHALDVMTPAVDLTAEEIDRPFFWVNVDGAPFEFQFDATDWGERTSRFSTAAMFVKTGATIAEVRQAYHDKNPVSILDGQALVIADPFALAPGQAPSENRWGDPLETPRNTSDTELEVLSLRLDAIERTSEPLGEAPFQTVTHAFEARIPSLSRLLDADANRDWFSLCDPTEEGNFGEVFAERADAISTRAIEVRFEQQSLQSGGLAAPSTQVAGVSRIYGPVGDTKMLRNSAEQGFDLRQYFPDAARFLGTLPLNRIVTHQSSKDSQTDQRSPAIPQFSFTLEDVEDDDCKDNDDDTQNVGNKEADENNDKPPRYHQEIEFKLLWRLPFLNDWPAPRRREDKTFDYSPCLLLTGQGKSALVPNPEKRSDINVAVSYRRILGSQRPTTTSPDASDKETSEKSGNDKSRNLFTLSASITNFSLQLLLAGNGVRAQFDKLAISIDSRKQFHCTPDLDTIELVGALLGFVRALQKVIGYVPAPPSGDDPEPIKSPKLSTPGDGAIAVSLGPLMAPTVELGIFTLEKLSLRTTFDIYFSQKPMRIGLYLSSAQQPFELVAATMGGGGFLAVRFDCEQLTDFDISMEFGAIKTIDFAVAKGKVKITGGIRFTMIRHDGQEVIELVAFVRLNGKATVLGFIQIALEVLVGLHFQIEGQRHVLYGQATVKLSIGIGFFSLPIAFEYQVIIAGSSEQQTRLATTPQATPPLLAKPSALLNESHWHAYWSAFA